MAELTSVVQSLANKRNAVHEIVQKYAGAEPDISWNSEDPRRPQYGGVPSYFLHPRKPSLIPEDPVIKAGAAGNHASSALSYPMGKKKEIKPRKSTVSKRYEEHYGLNSQTVSDVKLLRRDDPAAAAEDKQ